MESLIRLLREKDHELIRAYQNLLHAREVQLLPISQSVLREAARLRAERLALRTPDALHAATCRLHGCQQFLTNDETFRNMPDLPVTMLRDALAD